MMATVTSEVISEATKVCKPPVKCPWGTAPIQTTVTSLEDVMSEELAKDLQIKENAIFISQDNNEIDIPHETDCSSDFLLAQYLQMEYDKEHDQNVNREQAKVNGNSKVSVSYSNYLRSLETGDDDEDDDDYLDLDSDKRDWDNFETCEKESPVIPKCGYTKTGGVITTKHDTELSARRNACRVMEFPPGIHTGDGGGFDMQLNNSTFNKLKVHSLNESKRQQRLHDKTEKSTTMQTLDVKTMLILRKMVDNEILDTIDGAIASGKESVVFHATGGKPDLEEGQETKPIPEECAIKVFKTTLNEFKNRDKYIADDHRFRDRLSKQNPRRTIHLWAEKEMRNLSRMHAANIPCPEVVMLKKHVLVMSFIGKNGRAAPRLKEAAMSKADLIVAHDNILDLMKRMFVECRLVHADLSEFNILWFDDSCWLIDVSQAVDYNHPAALLFLYRDSQNIANFFEKRGVPGAKTAKQIFEHVSGIALKGEGKELEDELLNNDRGNKTLGVGLETNFAFDNAWSHSKK